MTFQPLPSFCNKSPNGCPFSGGTPPLHATHSFSASSSIFDLSALSFELLISFPLTPFDPVRQLIFVARFARKMAGERLAHELDGRDHRLGEPALLQHRRHLPGCLPPELVATFLVRAGVGPEGELAGQWRKINQRGVSMARAPHAQLCKTSL